MGHVPPEIRSATSHDRAAIARLIGQLGYAAEPDDVADRLAAMQADGHVVLIAELDGELTP